MANLDTLFLIMQHLARPRDVSAMMKTRKIIHGAGIRRLVNAGATLHAEADIVSFCAFVLADAPARTPFLRNVILEFLGFEIHMAYERKKDLYLSVDGGVIALDTLTLVIEKATNLRTLRLDSSEEFLETTPGYFCVPSSVLLETGLYS